MLHVIKEISTSTDYLGSLNVPFREINKFRCLYNPASVYNLKPCYFLSDVTEHHLYSARPFVVLIDMNGR